MNVANTYKYFLYLLILLTAFFCFALFSLGMYESFLHGKVVVATLILLIPIFFRDNSLGRFGTYVILGLFCYTVADYLFTDYHMVPYPILFYSLGNVFITIAICSFQGYTFNTRALAIILSVVLLFHYFAMGKLGSDFSFVLLYTATVTFMAWQGIGYYFMKRSLGSLMILLYITLFLANNILRGMNDYVVLSWVLIVTCQITFWLGNVFLASATIIPKDTFDRRL